ncbi:PEP-CTERM-box response regulator transcription factor [Candidatus Endoriftia persephonae]|jgi:two-component system NtrC family response regulator|uniref:Two component, sigma54 specific, transcriptional regulator, Fis family n=4 Tax=Gammaproteobacteria TaxID=1236 RepID=G2FHI0_9GAMM|nr:PEP-CTERM-box response regulator transcription factor [Candidatus Endoriftia persephone]EGV51902.1 two component, sigma54 specific, transcriptional regulator [endosymbiont of Riftia pachyptila (vent Ph05)]EGW53740.1 two component, sigma54 specific, transcriptional regulator, Fis family [endosymbiont of Tevnia jerichonana (vent Tica)]KRT55785.1 PEP-CTERM-box response regulator transcription factor [endosymbiont of Ridgeia piscesae]KRT58423.1 two-component system, NtrC family, response regulat
MLRPLLIVEDDPGLQSQLRWCFDGYDAKIAGDRESAIAALRRFTPPVVTLDLGLPPDPANVSEGLLTLKQILSLAPHTKVIVVTGNDDRLNALKSLEFGAYDFYQKPIDPEVLKVIIDRAYQLYELEAENRAFSAQQRMTPLDGVIASSTEMISVCRVIERVSPTDATVLLLGESGTGKEVLAKAVHDLSDRSENKFVAINCASIPETLLESELFGYEKGAFTGAAKRTLGKIETATGGTLFLDEIGDMPIGLQAKLLRFLQERVIERVGGREVVPVDVRVVCATNRNLEEMIQSSEFREDLFYRVSEITINIPPLREREGDAVMLAWAFLAKFASQNSSKVRGFSKEALQAIESYFWPGNVREMMNKVKRAVIMAEGSQITPEELQLSSGGENLLPFNLREVRERAEAKAVERALNYVEGNVSKAAELLGVSRPTLYDLVNKHDLK